MTLQGFIIQILTSEKIITMFQVEVDFSRTSAPAPEKNAINQENYVEYTNILFLNAYKRI